VLQRFADSIFDGLIHEHRLAKSVCRWSGKDAKNAAGKL